METIDKHGVNTVFRDGGGSMYDRAKNTIYIDVKNGSPTAGLVHEATHARWTREGWTADVSRLDRTSFVNRSLDEETDAAVNEIRTITELRKKGIEVPNSALQSHYTYGYNNAVQWSDATARAQGRPLTYAELDQAGQLGGRGAVSAAYHSGTDTRLGRRNALPAAFGCRMGFLPGLVSTVRAIDLTPTTRVDHDYRRQGNPRVHQ